MGPSTLLQPKPKCALGRMSFGHEATYHLSPTTNHLLLIQVRPGAASERFRLDGKHALGRVDVVPLGLLA